MRCLHDKPQPRAVVTASHVSSTIRFTLSFPGRRHLQVQFNNTANENDPMRHRCSIWAGGGMFDLCFYCWMDVDAHDIELERDFRECICCLFLSLFSWKIICNSCFFTIKQLGWALAEILFLVSPSPPLTSCGLSSTLLHVHTSRKSLLLPRPQETHLTFSPRLPHRAFPFLRLPPETRASQLSLASWNTDS